MMLTDKDEKKMNSLLNKLFHLYAYLSVLMQMEMAYSNESKTKTFLGVIANRVQGLDAKVVETLKTAKRLDDYVAEHEIQEYLDNESEESYLLRKTLFKEVNQQFTEIRGACGLIGIELKTNYSVHDAIAFANKV
tara:strand:- start:203 stop:607 length:405 start_codon:yes stop_codon:yes gene_type:complete